MLLRYFFVCLCEVYDRVTTKKIIKAIQLAWLTNKEQEERVMGNLLWHTMGDYCKRIDVGQIYLEFQPDNPITFNVKILFWQV